MTQTEIFDAIRNCPRKESKAIELLFKTLFPKVKSIALKAKLLEDDAQCILQDAVISLVYKIKADEFTLLSDNAFQRYVLRYAKNRVLSLARKQNQTSSYSSELSISDSQGPVINVEELINAILKLAKNRSKRGAEVLYRRFFQGQGYQLIANEMNYTSHSAKNQLYRVLSSIRQEISLEDFIR